MVCVSGKPKLRHCYGTMPQTILKLPRALQPTGFRFSSQNQGLIFTFITFIQKHKFWLCTIIHNLFTREQQAIEYKLNLKKLELKIRRG